MRPRAGSFVHDALLHQGDEELLKAARPFLEGASSAGESGAVVAEETTLALLEDALGPTASELELVDARDWYATPARAIASYREMVEDHLAGGARRVRVLGQLPFPDGVTDQRRWLRYEALLNHALGEHPVWFLCPYDARTLSGWSRELVTATHPRIGRAGHRARRNRHYRAPAAVADDLAPKIESGRKPPVLDSRVDGDRLPEARTTLRSHLRGRGVGGGRAAELATGLHEVSAGAVRHHGRARVRCWLEAGALICEVDPTGLDVAPVAGYSPPPPDDPDAQGLWLARQIYDEVASEQVAGGRLVTRMIATLPRGVPVGG